jgi:hypothetical protein
VAAETPLVADAAVRAITVLRIGDTRRPAFGRAVRAALLAAAAFESFTIVTKQIGPVYQHVPWADDPYDTFVSFAMFFVPLALLVAGLRLVLCRRAEPLPLARLVGVVRATWLALIVSLFTLAADWAGVLSGGRSGNERDAIATASIVALTLTTSVVLGGAIVLARVRPPRADTNIPDGIADALTLARAWARRRGPARRPVSMVVTLGDARIAPLVRHRPVTVAALVALAFGSALALASSREYGPSPVALLVGGVAACAMFAFAVAGGAWLGLVAPDTSTAGHRRLVRATVAGAAAVPASLAFRDAIWSMTGLGGDHGLVALAALVVAAGIVTFCSALVLAVLHRERP